MKKCSATWLLKGCALLSVFPSVSTHAQQIVADDTLPENTIVTPQGDVIQIDGGTTRGSNLFHSFQEFSVPDGSEASFNNPDTISNILSRVTGGGESVIEGSISANGTANLFLINPAGIIFGSNSRLDIGGSFLGSTADSILFPDGIEYSATNLQTPPILTINAPIGLGFRDNPEDITNSSLFDIGTDSEDFLVGLRVAEDETLALVGGNVFIDEGFLSTIGGRIEIGGVAGNNTVSLTEVEKGWDVGYEEVENFQDVNFSVAAFVESKGANTGDIEVQGRNITLTEGSQIVINTEEGQSGNLSLTASESIELDGNGLEILGFELPTQISNNILGQATGAESQIKVEAPQLTLTNGGQIAALNDPGSGQGVDIVITASEIVLAKPFIDEFNGSGILAQVSEEAIGDGGNIIIETEKLTVNEAQINTDTLGAGNAGDLQINASESIELIGVISESIDETPEGNLEVFPSALFSNVGETANATGNAGDITVNTPRLMVRDGAQISAAARNQGNAGTLTINAPESVLLTGTSPSAVFQGEGRSGIVVSTEKSFNDQEGNPVVTTGNGGTLNLNTSELIIERGAQISADTRSLGDGGNANIDVNKLILRDGGEINAGSFIGVDVIDAENPERGTGGNLDINATESVEITGIGDINGELVNSSIFTLAESNGDAGDITLTTDNLTVSEGGEINTSASASGAAGDLTITADSLDLNRGELNAETAAGRGGNIKLEIDDTINLSNESLISAAATGTASGGNITIDTTFIIARPNGDSDIIASAREGAGGRITIDAEGIFGIRERLPSDRTNDIDASGGVDGEVTINTPDVDVTRGLVENPQNIIEPEQTKAQACRSDRASAKESGLTIKGKGGIPAQPTAPLTADSISVNGQTNTQSKEVQYQDITSIPTSIGNITPARGMIKTEDGRVILTAYRTNYSDRSPDSQINCASN